MFGRISDKRFQGVLLTKTLCFSLIFNILTTFCCTLSTVIECDYNINMKYWVLGRIYCCSVKSHPNINSLESSQINATAGNHIPGRSYYDVIGFDSFEKNIEIFPHGLDNIFPSLQMISIWYGRIKEIHQSDLKSLRKLIYLSLDQNNIEVLEDGLFDYNLNLEVISLSNNKIYHIDQNVFDNLPKLSYLCLYLNVCINKDVRASRPMVLDVIKLTKNQCINSRYLNDREESNRIAKSRKLERIVDGNSGMMQMIMALNERVSKLEDQMKSRNDSIQRLY